jgi:N-acyl homoserine lactone hydrolase
MPDPVVNRLAVLLCGYEILRKSDSTRGRGGRLVFASPITAYLLDTAAGLALVDAGVNAEVIRDPGLREEYYGRHGYMPPVVHPEHELLAQLTQLGVAPRDVGLVLLTHMHMDHTGNLKHFRHATVAVQRREHAHAFGPHHSPAWFPIDYDLGLRWDLRDGDWEPLPGVRALATYGHTPGHQSFLVELPSGPTLIVGDVGDLAENFADEVLPGEASDDGEALASIRRVKRVAAERGARLLIGHDPAVIHAAPLAPEWLQ